MITTKSIAPLDRSAPTYIAGHKGLVGSALWRKLEQSGFTDLIGRTSAELDLRNRADVFAFFEAAKPSCVVLAAAKVGGIVANNTYPVDFISDNLQIQTNVLDAALRHGVRRLLFLGSSCIYPRLAPQPIREDQLLNGHLEPTNDRALAAFEDPHDAAFRASIRVALDACDHAVAVHGLREVGRGDVDVFPVRPLSVLGHHEPESPGISREAADDQIHLLGKAVAIASDLEELSCRDQGFQAAPETALFLAGHLEQTRQLTRGRRVVRMLSNAGEQFIFGGHGCVVGGGWWMGGAWVVVGGVHHPPTTHQPV